MSIAPQRRASPSIASDLGPQESLDPDLFFSPTLEDTCCTDIHDSSESASDVTKDPSFIRNEESKADAGRTHTIFSPPSFAQDFLTPDCSSDNLCGDPSAPDSPSWDENWWGIDALNGSIASVVIDENSLSNVNSLGLIDYAAEESQPQTYHNGDCSHQPLPPPQLMSPQLTNTPSPAQHYSQSPATGTMGGPTSQSEQHPLRRGVADMTGQQADSYHAYVSPDPSSANLQSQLSDPPNRARSPIFRVSVYNRGDSPARSAPRLARSSSQRSRTSQSSNLLAPADCYSSKEEDEPVEQGQVQPSASRVARNDDGSWLASTAGRQGGIDPTERGDSYVSSIKQLEDQRNLDEKNAEIASWLDQSDAGSEISDHAAVTEKPKKRSTRPRARTVGTCIDPVGPDDLNIRDLPGPGALIDEDSEAEYSEESASTSPPADVDLQSHNTEDRFSPSVEISPEHEEPLPRQFIRARPWQDHLKGAEVSDNFYQPMTANAAMHRYDILASKFEAASRIATWGTQRRQSDPDIQSIWSGQRERKLSLVQKTLETGNTIVRQASRILPRRNSSVSKSRGENATNDMSHAESLGRRPADTLSSLKIISRKSSVGRKPRTPSLNTRDAMFAITGHLTAVGQSTSATNDSGEGPTSPFETLKRARSRSETRPPGKPDVAAARAYDESRLESSVELPAQQSKLMEKRPARGVDGRKAANEEGLTTGSRIARLDLKVKTENIVPNLEGFRIHAQRLNPRLEPFLTDRIVYEQRRRYRKLLDIRTKHTHAVQSTGRCSSKNFCFELGGEAKEIPIGPNSKNSDMSSGQFLVPGTEDPNRDVDAMAEGATSAAPFPVGIPLPPVKRLPAEFECPICFQVKVFRKPSDWTKHVHEDIQPFTCTFPKCAEVRSFKRKADWVRHENEKHRHLEWWRCQIPDCNHECYRKDNFVQHLVREHKRPDPKIRPQGAGGADADPAAARQSQVQEREIDEVWKLVDECHFETQNNPKDEVCRFCKNSCEDWKKLTVHLAKHMEQIAMPILGLVQGRTVVSDPSISPSNQDNGGQGIPTPEPANLEQAMGNPGGSLSPHVGVPPNQHGGFEQATQSPSAFSQESYLTHSMQNSPSFSHTTPSSHDGQIGLQPSNMAHFTQIHNLPQNMSYGPYQTPGQPSGSIPFNPSGVVPQTYPPTFAVGRSPQSASPKVLGAQPGVLSSDSIYHNGPRQGAIYSSPTAELGPYGQGFDLPTTRHLQQDYSATSMTYNHNGLTTGMATQMPESALYSAQTHHPAAFLPNPTNGQKYWYRPPQ